MVKKKIPLLLLLKSIGLSSKKIFTSIKYKKLLITILFKEKINNIYFSIQKITKIIFQKEYNVMLLK
jgi:hypothetical protein